MARYSGAAGDTSCEVRPWSTSGSRSNPLGQTIVRSSGSTRTWRMTAGSRSGSPIGPDRSAARSRIVCCRHRRSGGVCGRQGTRRWLRRPMRRMLGQRADAGQLFVDADRSQLTRSPLRRTAQGDEGVDRSVDGWVDLESTLEPPNSPAAPGLSAWPPPRLPAPHVCHEGRVRVVGVVALGAGVRRGWSTPEGKLMQARKDAVGGRGGDLREQLEAGDVLRTDDAEMASVQGADTACAESLGDRDEAAVDAAEVLIGVLNGERGDSGPVHCG